MKREIVSAKWMEQAHPKQERMVTNWNPADIRHAKRQGRADDIDHTVGARLRARRIQLGLTQQQLAEAADITYQQAHKYEQGINRIACGRLWRLCRVLGVEPNYFFLDDDGQPIAENERKAGKLQTKERDRMMLEIAQNVQRLPMRKQKIISALARLLNEDDNGG